MSALVQASPGTLTVRLICYPWPPFLADLVKISPNPNSTDFQKPGVVPAITANSPQRLSTQLPSSHGLRFLPHQDEQEAQVLKGFLK